MELFVVQRKTHGAVDEEYRVEIYGIHLTRSGAEERMETLEKRNTVENYYYEVEEWSASQ